MKTKFNVIALALSSVLFTGGALAEQKNVFDDSLFGAEVSASEVKVDLTGVSISAEIEPEVKKRVDKASKSAYQQVEAYIDPDVSAKRSKEISEKEHELSLIKLDMEKAQLEESLEEINSKRDKVKLDSLIAEKEAELEGRIDSIEMKYQGIVKGLQSEIASLKKELYAKNQSTDAVTGKIFVTKTYGVGQNMVAQFYFENNVTEHSVGEMIIPGVKIVKIDSNGAVVSYKGKQKLVSLTTMEYAHRKTFEAKDEEMKYLEQELELENLRAQIDQTRAMTKQMASGNMESF